MILEALKDRLGHLVRLCLLPLKDQRDLLYQLLLGQSDLKDPLHHSRLALRALLARMGL